MSEPIDIFAWLYEIGADDDSFGVRPASVFWELGRAKRAHDLEGVIAARRTFEQIAAQHNLPWLGVFGRHWELQHRLIERGEGATAIPDAVAAFEAAHRPETIECPQSVCTVQDLCMAFGNVDGPGYAEQTLAASRDALDRIDTSWPCWDCLSHELIDALEFAGESAQVVDKIVEVEVELRASGAMPSVAYARRRLVSLVDSGRPGEAEAFDTALVRNRYNAHSDNSWPRYELARVPMLVAVDRDTEALEAFDQSPDPVERPEFADDWRSALEVLSQKGLVKNTDEMSAKLVRLAHVHQSTGAWRRAFDTGAVAARRAAERGAVGSARRARALCEAVLPELHKPVDAPDKLVAIDAALTAAPSEVAETAPLDSEVARLEASLAENFDAENLAQLANLLRFQGWENEASALLWDRVQSEPGDKDAAQTLIRQLVEADAPDDDEVLKLAELIEDAQPVMAHWARALLFQRRNRWAECADECARVVELEAASGLPQTVNARRLWAHAASQAGDYTGSAELSGEVLLGGLSLQQRSADLWSAIVNGSLAADWQLVRRAAAEIGMSFTTDTGPVSERWEDCAVVFTDDDGVERPWIATRTGPATATVRQISIGIPQHYGDQVVFDPTPRNQLPPDASDERKANFLFEYPVRSVVAAGNATAFPIEGVLPDDEPATQDAFRDGLLEAGFGVWLWGRYDEHHRPSGIDRLVTQALLAIGPDQSPQDLHNYLEALTSEWEHPLAWADLAEAAGADAAAHRQRAATMWGERDDEERDDEERGDEEE